MKLIPKDTINFLRELKLNNNRDWFNENKLRFNSIQNGVKEFATEVNESLKKSDDILNAVKTAKEMFTTLDKFNIKMIEEGYPKLNIGIGINYGKVICGNIGSEQQMNYTVIGDTVNLASRLCSAAKPGEIIISDSVYKNLDDNKGFSINEELLLKGKKQPVKNWKFSY